MDTMNFLIGVVIMMIAASFEQFWLVLGIAVVLVLSNRSLNGVLLVLITLGALYFFQGSIQEYAPYLLFGLIILAMGLGGEEKASPYPPDLGMGGMEGFGQGPF